jgi:hypothetical protein
LCGFKEIVPGLTEYFYDNNGNMIRNRVSNLRVGNPGTEQINIFTTAKNHNWK